MWRDMNEEAGFRRGSLKGEQVGELDVISVAIGGKDFLHTHGLSFGNR